MLKSIQEIGNTAYKDDIEALGVVLVDSEGNILGENIEVSNFPASQVVEGEVTTELTDLQDQLVHYLPVKPVAETDPVMIKKSCTATDTPEVVHADTACRKVTLQANPANTVSIFVAFTQGTCDADALELPPGYSWTEYVSNLNKIWYQGLISEKLLVVYTP